MTVFEVGNEVLRAGVAEWAVPFAEVVCNGRSQVDLNGLQSIRHQVAQNAIELDERQNLIQSSARGEDVTARLERQAVTT